MKHDIYQKQAGACVGLTMQALCGIGMWRNSPQESTAKKRLWSLIDHAFKAGSQDPDGDCAEITDEFERVLSAIGLPDDKAKLVLDTLYDELGTQFCGEGGNR